MKEEENIVEVDKKLLEDCYHLIDDFTDDMGWCTVCDGNEQHKPDCWQQKTLSRLRDILGLSKD